MGLQCVQAYIIQGSEIGGEFQPGLQGGLSWINLLPDSELLVFAIVQRELSEASYCKPNAGNKTRKAN